MNVVVLSSYNGLPYIEPQLDSILTQSLPPEIVLIRDDGSTDGTIQFVENYIQNNQLKNWYLIQNSVNQGWKKNFRQLLIDAQKFEPDYIFFADQDDIWYADKIEKQVKILNQRKDIDLLSGDLDFKFEDSKATDPHLYEFLDKDAEISKYPITRIFKAGFRQGMTLAIRNTFVKDVLDFGRKIMFLLMICYLSVSVVSWEQHIIIIALWLYREDTLLQPVEINSLVYMIQKKDTVRIFLK